MSRVFLTDHNKFTIIYNHTFSRLLNRKEVLSTISADDLDNLQSNLKFVSFCSSLLQSYYKLAHHLELERFFGYNK